MARRKYPSLCSVDGCGQPHHSRGYCSSHVKRLMRYGDPLYEAPRQPDTCQADDCDKPSETRGVCGAHYHRLYRYGDANYRPDLPDLSGVDISLYLVWNGMKQRCFNPNVKGYERYGGRGITVCKRWRESYFPFIEDLGVRPAKGMSLDRKDNDGNYSCGKCDECRRNGWTANVHWATKQEQVNNSTSVRWLTCNGKTQTIAQWTREKGLRKGTIVNRLADGWSVEDAINKPIAARYRQVVKEAA